MKLEAATLGRRGKRSITALHCRALQSGTPLPPPHAVGPPICEELQGLALLLMTGVPVLPSTAHGQVAVAVELSTLIEH